MPTDGALAAQLSMATKPLARLGHAAGQRDEAARPARRDKRLLAFLLGAVDVQEFRRRQIRLELNSVHRRGTTPARMRPSFTFVAHGESLLNIVVNQVQS
jgi:hypothetical protein